MVALFVPQQRPLINKTVIVIAVSSHMPPEFGFGEFTGTVKKITGSADGAAGGINAAVKFTVCSLVLLQCGGGAISPVTP